MRFIFLSIYVTHFIHKQTMRVKDERTSGTQSDCFLTCDMTHITLRDRPRLSVFLSLTEIELCFLAATSWHCASHGHSY